jgi:hypothetical protein
MKMPPPGQRFVAASWIAVAAALLTVAVGTTALLMASDALPERIILRWDGIQPDITMSVGGTLVLAAALALGSCLAVLGLGFAMHRSVRHGLAGYALGAGLTLGLGTYSLALAQAWAEEAMDSQQTLIGAGLVGFLCGWLLTRWVRAPALHDDPLPAVASLELPPSARLMWSGAVPVNLRLRLGVTLGIFVPLTALYWWWGIPLWLVAAPMAGATVGRLRAARHTALAIDYSGIGLRGKSGGMPSPIRLGDVRSAEVTQVSAIRDFGGIGYLTAPDGRQGWITRSGEALVVHRHGKPDFVYTVDDAAEAAAVLNTLVARYQSRDQTLTA